MKTHHLLASSLLSVLASAVVTLASGEARATPCAADGDCAKGLKCQTSTETACPDIACAPDENCVQPVCDPVTTSACVPGPCNTDNDCAVGMVCFASTQSNCTTAAAPPCAADVTTCAPDPPVDAGCSTTTTKTCVPRYVPPCQTATDCGAGFDCVAEQECACAGSAGSDPGVVVNGPEQPADPKAPTSPPAVDGGTPASCSCTDTGTSSCIPKSITCKVDGDCPSMWTCIQPPTETTGCAVAASVDGGPSPEPCTPIVSAPVASICEPPYMDIAESTGFGSASASSEDTNGSAATPTASSAGSAGSAPAVSNPSSQGGCQLGSGRVDASAGAWVGLFGLAAFARRRRARRVAS